MRTNRNHRLFYAMGSGYVEDERDHNLLGRREVGHIKTFNDWIGKLTSNEDIQ